MMVQVYSEKDKNILINNGLKFICENKLGDTTCYTFEFNNNKLNFDGLDVKYKITNRLTF